MALTYKNIVAAGLTASLAWGAALSAEAQSYSHAYQYAVGEPAQFDMAGPATQGDSQGDALIQSVTMPNGEVFSRFYRPVEISYFAYSGSGRNFDARAGSRCVVGTNRTTELRDADGQRSGDSFSARDVELMPDLILEVLETENLNNYVDTSSNNGWQFVMTFELPLVDNDPEPDDFGELLYFERGSSGGNSWLTFLAVDENNNPLPGATPLAVSPSETVLTTPRIVVAGDQPMGAVAIDISRLGVSRTNHLRVMSSVRGVGGYTGGENRADFKVMAVITDPEQLDLLEGNYD